MFKAELKQKVQFCLRFTQTCTNPVTKKIFTLLNCISVVNVSVQLKMSWFVQEICFKKLQKVEWGGYVCFSERNMGGRKKIQYINDNIYIKPTTRGSSRWKISKSLGSSAVKHLKCKWTHSSSPMLHINYRHHISALFFAFWAQTTCFMKCLSFYQRINMQFVRRMRDPLPSGKDGFLPPKHLCFQFWGVFLLWSWIYWFLWGFQSYKLHL